MKKFLILFAVIIISGSFIFPQATSGKVKMRGNVYDIDTGKPIQGVKVKLYSIRAQAFSKVSPVTDKEGHWKSLFMRGGKWYLDFSKVGYAPKRIAVSYIFVGKYHAFVNGKKYEVLETKMKKVEGPALGSNIVKDIEKANNLLANNKIKTALKSFRDIQQKNKDVQGIEIINLYIGNCYSLLKNDEKAIVYFLKALKKYPKHKGLILSIGNSYANMKKMDKAIEWFGKLDDEDITNTDTLYNIGVNFYNKMMYKKAIGYFKKAVELKNDFADAYFQMGMTYVALNNIPEALKALKKSMELNPNSPNYQTASELVKAFSNK